MLKKYISILSVTLCSLFFNNQTVYSSNNDSVNDKTTSKIESIITKGKKLSLIKAEYYYPNNENYFYILDENNSLKLRKYLEEKDMLILIDPINIIFFSNNKADLSFIENEDENEHFDITFDKKENVIYFGESFYYQIDYLKKDNILEFYYEDVDIIVKLYYKIIE